MLVGVGLLAWAPAAYATRTAASCRAAKLSFVAGVAAQELRCFAAAARRGTGLDPRCRADADTKLTVEFSRIEARGGCVPARDVATYLARLDNFATDVAAGNRCAEKIDAAGREARELLKCHARALRRGATVDARCLATARRRFARLFDRSDSRACGAANDRAQVEALVDAYVAAPTSDVAVQGTYDVTPSLAADAPAYVPVVDQFTVLNLTVLADRGGPLTIGHPVEMRADVRVEAEPFQSMVWYGLQSDDGRYCVIGHVTLDHLGAVYEKADRANLALDDAALADEPSLADCAETRTCEAEGEECLSFREQRPLEYPSAPSDAGDPNSVIPQEPEGDAPPSEVEIITETTYRCATTSYAAARVARAATAPARVTPAQLAGKVEQRHLLGAVSELPEACAPLVGAGNLSAWMAFDPDGATNFANRPEAEWPEIETPPPLDQTQAEYLQGLAAYTQRLPETVPLGPLEPDPGLDLKLRHLQVGSSVTLIDSEEHHGGDLHVNVEYSLDGEPNLAQQEALGGATVEFRFTLKPVGALRAGCTPPNPLPSVGQESLLIVHTNEDQSGSEVVAEPVTNFSTGTGIDKSFPLSLSPVLRAKVYDEWACWDQFHIEGCLTTNLPQASTAHLGTANDCATTSVLVLRNQPPENAEITDAPILPRTARLARIGNPGCSDQLFKDYAENMRRYYELSNRVTVTDHYTYDIMQWIWGSLTYGTTGPGMSYITNAARQTAYFNHVKSFIIECEQLGGNGCWNTWGFRNSPWNIDIANYQNQLLPYFWNAWGRSGGESYLKFKNNPQEFTRTGFNFECAGIATGAVCSEINYDLARVPELAGRVRDVLVNRRRSDALAAKISPHGVGRCLDRAYPALQRTLVDAQGRLTVVPDDNVFYTEYLAQVCEKGKYKAAADALWAQIASSCTYVARPFADSGAGIYAGRFAPDLYRSYDTGFKAGLKGVAEGGIINDYLVATQLQQFKLIFGAQGRIYLESDPNNDIVGGWLNVYDIFKAWLLGNFYSDLVSSNVEAGFHVMTHDIWKISYKVPQGEFQLPDPPELSKEVEKCKYLWKFPMPFRIELCGAVGGKADLTVDARVLKSGIAGADPSKVDWPGVSGRVTPGVAITNKGRAGIDVFVASAGLVIVLDPTIGVFIPVEVGAKWNLSMPNPRQLNFTLAPFVKTTLELRALGGSVNGYTRWKVPSSDEKTYPIPGASWDPLDIGNLAGQEWVLTKHSWDISGNKVF